MKTLDESNNNQVVQLGDATSFSVRLAQNGTTGHTWAPPTFDHEILTLESDDIVSPPANAPPGAGGARSFVFRVKAAGTAKIETTYGRSWDSDSAGASRFAVTVVAKG